MIFENVLSRNATCCIISFILMCTVGKSIQAESRLVVSEDGGEVEWRVTMKGDRISFWDDGNILELDSGDGCTTS